MAEKRRMSILLKPIKSEKFLRAWVSNNIWMVKKNIKFHFLRMC